MKNLFFLGPFFLLVSEPGRSEPGALSFFCLVSEPGQRGSGALLFFCLVSWARYAVCRLTVKNQFRSFRKSVILTFINVNRYYS